MLFQKVGVSPKGISIITAWYLPCCLTALKDASISEAKALKFQLSQKRLSPAQASGLEAQFAGANERQFGVITGLGSTNTLHAVCGPELAPAELSFKAVITMKHNIAFRIDGPLVLSKWIYVQVTP